MMSTDPSADAGQRDEDVLAGTPYRLIRRLGHGGTAEVFLVEHLATGRPLVVKLLYRHLLGFPEVVEAACVEARALAALKEPNVVEVVDFRRARCGMPILVMEYLEGRTLREELRARGELPISEALQLTRQALTALTAVHRLGIVHRDIKPENLFLCRTNGSPLLKLLDFGLARIIPGVSPDGPVPSAIPIEAGTVVGTPGYLSPEAAFGKRVDPRADLYQVALVTYELIAGRGPFDDHPNGFRLCHCIEEPPPPSRHSRQPIPRELDRVILRALAKDPDERFSGAEEFLEQIDHIRALLENSRVCETALDPEALVHTKAPTARGSALAEEMGLRLELKSTLFRSVVRAQVLERRKPARVRALLVSTLVTAVTAVTATGAIAELIARLPR